MTFCEEFEKKMLIIFGGDLSFFYDMVSFGNLDLLADILIDTKVNIYLKKCEYSSEDM